MRDNARSPAGSRDWSPVGSTHERNEAHASPAKAAEKLTGEITNPPVLNEVECGSLDFDKPGLWVINHHQKGLITKIYEPKPGLFSGLLENFSHGGTKKPASRDEGSELWRGPTEKLSYRISFAELQRVKLRKLQCKLVKHVVDMRYCAIDPPGWEDDLRQFGQSLRRARKP